MAVGDMKKLLIIPTGGTIGSACGEDARRLNKESTEKTRSILFSAFSASASPYAAEAELFSVADYPWEYTTLSESMTPDKLAQLIRYIGTVAAERYRGIIVLHGTDSLAFTAACLSFAFSGLSVPLFLVSGNRPPEDPLSNAADNFRYAAELILDGIAPNVYVTYRNSDGISRLYLASCLLQSENFSEDFRAAEGRCERAFRIAPDTREAILREAQVLSDARVPPPFEGRQGDLSCLAERILYIRPYTGLDYGVYTAALRGGARYTGVLHGSYHSGTVSRPGLVLEAEARRIEALAEGACLSGGASEAEALLREAARLRKAANAEAMAPQSIEVLLSACKAARLPLYIAPSQLGRDQYETMNAVAASGAILLPMSAEAAYMKLVLAHSFGLSGEAEIAYMVGEQNNEAVL